MQRAALPVLLALLLVLAGCSGTQAPGTATTEHGTTERTTTAAGTSTTTDASTTTTTAERLALGVTRSGVVNASRLVDAHVAALDASGYEHRVRLAMATRMSKTNETFTSNLTRRVRATPGRDAYRLRSVRVEGDDDARRETVRAEWSNGTVRLLRVESGNRTVYERLDPVGPGGAFEREVRLTGRLLLRNALRRGGYRVESVADRNGSTRVTLVADSAPNATAFSATVVVDGDGLVRRLNATMTMRTADSRQTRTLRYRLVRLGVERVERPAWADEALGNETA